ncbi:hypothetical protein U5A82_00135 [Sphingobium sp. CR2-8]|uniref:hypothetical protein n=1 Tax=Sphingobium sp. CR2-8 TaxID=1306534 RepID=UPI002DBF4F3F|nr:hypothetical protein [Sphingobium sp. CR2-8]MEC3908937.1 hypothetical protein [Sphingobium sp. CR2-8]
MSDNTLLFAYADAQSMLARLEERRRLSVVRRPWKIRCFIGERQALAWVDATTIDDSMFTVDGRGAVGGAEFDLTHWRQAVGADVTLETIQTDDAGLLDWLGVQDSGTATASWGTAGWPLDDIRHRVRLWQQDVAALPPPLP